MVVGQRTIATLFRPVLNELSLVGLGNEGISAAVASPADLLFRREHRVCNPNSAGLEYEGRQLSGIHHRIHVRVADSSELFHRPDVVFRGVQRTLACKKMERGTADQQASAQPSNIAGPRSDSQSCVAVVTLE